MGPVIVATGGKTRHRPAVRMTKAATQINPIAVPRASVPGVPPHAATTADCLRHGNLP